MKSIWEIFADTLPIRVFESSALTFKRKKRIKIEKKL
uniref:Uncharacterized protein n=1 Tax=Rhizophora mucronata TaxID=61149 RepID=A0A2P2QQJ1_RHIMU